MAVEASLPATGHPNENLISRTLLFGNPERANVRISPNGKQLSWIAPHRGVLNVWVAPLAEPDQAKVVTNDSTRPIYSYFWAHTSKHILYMQDTAGDENFHVFRVDLADGSIVDLTPFAGTRSDVFALSHREPTTVLIQSNDRNPKAMDLYAVALDTGKRERLVQNDEDFFDYTVDVDLGVRLAHKKAADGSTLTFMAEKAKHGKLTWKPFDSIPFEDAETSFVLGFAPSGKALYLAESRGRDTAAIVELELATKRARVLAEDPKSDAGWVLIHPTKKTLQAVSFEYERRSWTVLDKSIQKDIDALVKLDGGEPHIVSRSNDDELWVVVTTSDQHPANYYVWDRGKQASTFLFALQPALDEQPLVKMWPVVIESRDGLELVSYLSLPASADVDNDGKPEKPVPMVLWVHGGPWGRDRWGFNSIHQLLANRGYAVLSVNFRGSAGFGKKFLNAANLQWSKAMHDDLLDAVAWAVDENITHADQVCIAGGSYGGYATLVGLAMTPEVFACGVDIVGPSNLITLMASIPPYWAPGMAMFHNRIGNPETPEGKALLTAASPLTYAANITKPLLIAQGANDPRVKQAESEQIVAAMKQAGLPVSYVLFPDEGHGFARPENDIAFFAVMEAFLSAHLGGEYLPISAAELEASTMQFEAGKDGIPGLP
jgi:dipeptidyl aminopeptidase/acylaminoacyl peptidase